MKLKNFLKFYKSIKSIYLNGKYIAKEDLTKEDKKKKILGYHMYNSIFYIRTK